MQTKRRRVHECDAFRRCRLRLRRFFGKAKPLAEHGVSARARTREGATAEILVDAPDGIEIQLQDVSYCGGRGRLGNMCS